MLEYWSNREHRVVEAVVVVVVVVVAAAGVVVVVVVETGRVLENVRENVLRVTKSIRVLE